MPARIIQSRPRGLRMVTIKFRVISRTVLAIKVSLPAASEPNFDFEGLHASSVPKSPAATHRPVLHNYFLVL